MYRSWGRRPSRLRRRRRRPLGRRRLRLRRRQPRPPAAAPPSRAHIKPCRVGHPHPARLPRVPHRPGRDALRGGVSAGADKHRGHAGGGITFLPPIIKLFFLSIKNQILIRASLVASSRGEDSLGQVRFCYIFSSSLFLESNYAGCPHIVSGRIVLPGFPLCVIRPGGILGVGCPGGITRQESVLFSRSLLIERI